MGTQVVQFWQNSIQNHSNNARSVVVGKGEALGSLESSAL